MASVLGGRPSVAGSRSIPPSAGATASSPRYVKAKALKGIVEADETFIRKSVKGSKRVVGRAPRRRGEKAKPGLSSDDYAPVLIVRDRHGATLDHVLPDLEAPTFARVMRPVVAADALLVSDSRASSCRPRPRPQLENGTEPFEGYTIKLISGTIRLYSN